MSGVCPVFMSRESRLSFLLVLFAPPSPSDRASVADGASSTTFSLFVIVFGVIPVYLPVCLRCLLYELLSSVCLGSMSGQASLLPTPSPLRPPVPRSPCFQFSDSLGPVLSFPSTPTPSLFSPYSSPSHSTYIPNPLLHILPPFPSPFFTYQPLVGPSNNHSP